MLSSNNFTTYGAAVLLDTARGAPPGLPDGGGPL